jgi:hypothetical protein
LATLASISPIDDQSGAHPSLKLSGRHFPEPTKLVGAPVKVISRSVEYMIGRHKLMIGRQELCTQPRID